MADWSVIESTLEAWAKAVTGLPARWDGRPDSPSFSDAGYLLLSITSIVVKGNPTLSETYNSGTDEVTYHQEQSLEFTFGVQVRTMARSVDRDAKHYTSLIRDRLFLVGSTAEVLDAADIAVQRILGDTPVPAELDGRDMSVHQLDIRMNAVSSVDDTPIETIRSLTDAEAQIPEGTAVWTGDIDIG